MSSGPNIKAAELREVGDDELTTKLREAKEELFNLRFQAVTGQLDNNRRLQIVRREIARIYTILRERELGIAVAPTPKPAEDKADDKKAAKSSKKAKSDEPTDEKEKTEVAA